MNERTIRGAAAAFAIATMTLAATAYAAGTAEQKCEGGKNDAAGKYAACVAKAEKSYVTKGDAVKYGVALGKCETKMVSTWGKLEQKAVDAMTTCPSTGDQSDIEDFLDACTQSVAVAVGGGSLPLDVITCNSDLGTCTTGLGTCTADLSTTNADLTICDNDLAVCEASPGATPVKTGQQACYSAGGAGIACAGTGQDGEFQIGAPASFTNNGDGTISDNATGLMWEVLTDDGSIHDKDTSYNWTNAVATKVAAVNAAMLGGYSDWRLPNVKELETLKYFNAVGPATYPVYNTNCMAACTAATCSCTRVGNYWSSTTDENGTTTAWYVGFAGGGVTTTAAKGSSLYVRLIRGTVDTTYEVLGPLRTGQTTAYGAGTDGDLERGAPRTFTDNGDGTITDNATGLMWEKKSDDGSIHDKDNTYTWGMTSPPYTMNGTMVTTFLADLNSGGGFAGYTDWRIPNIYELQSLVNFEVPYPGPTVFPEFNSSCTASCSVTTCSCTRSYYHWSSTTYRGNENGAWYVYFYNGGTNFFNYKTDGYSVRAVRGGS